MGRLVVVSLGAAVDGGEAGCAAAPCFCFGCECAVDGFAGEVAVDGGGGGGFEFEGFGAGALVGASFADD